MIAKPHGRDCPDRCSLCRSDAPVRRVAQTDNLITVDGEVVRPIELAPWHPGIKREQQQRGGRNKR